MNKIPTIFLLCLFLNPFNIFSQNKKWKSFRWEFIYGAGATNFYGDLGGASGNKHNFFTDLNLESTRYAGFFAVRWKYEETLSLKLNIIYCQVAGDDALSSNSTRSKRNLNFRSPIFEQSVQIEYSVIKERYGTFYSFLNMKRFSFSNINTYFFVGAGGFYFKPQVKVVNAWIPAVRQAKSSKGKKYSHYQAAFPIGIGFKYAINRMLCLGLELSDRFTTTDYIDNHSDSYSKHNDVYSLVLVCLSYRIKTAKNGLPKFKFR